MKMQLLVAIAALLPPVALALDVPTAPSPYLATQPGFEVSARRAEAEGTFEIRAQFSDAQTGDAFVVSSMMVRAGQWNTQTLAGKDMQPAVAFSATVDPTGHVAAFTASETRHGKETHSYSGTVMVSP